MAGALLLILLQSALVACQIAIKISTEPPPSFNDEVKDTKYIVGTLPPGAATPSHSRVLPMTDGNGTKYDCYIPGVDAADDTSSIEVASRALFMQQTPEQLLDALTDWCAYRVEDWWSYEVCYKQHVRQFHKEHGKVVAEYVLGQYSEEQSTLDSVQVDASDLSGKVKYVSQQYMDGDPCELNEQPRTTEVRYVCGSGSGPGRGSEHVITSIKEPASCSYLITISTPRLCKHPEFRDEPPPVASIRCIARAGSEAAAGSGSAAGDGSTAAVSSTALPIASASVSVGGQCSAEAAEGVCTPPDEASSGPSSGSSHNGIARSQGSPGSNGGPSGQGAAGKGGGGVAGQPSPAANASTPAEEEWRDEEGYMIIEGEPDPQAEEEGEFDDQLADEMYDAALREAAELDGGEEDGGDEDHLLRGHEEL